MSQGSSIFVNKPVGSACSPRDSRRRKQGGTQGRQWAWRDDALAAEVHLFFAEIDFLVDSGSRLTEEEREFSRSMRKKRRREYLAGRSLLRCALSFLFDPPRSEWILSEDSPHQPRLLNRPDLFLSLSHSGERLGCAVATGQPCGFDIEMHSDRMFADIAEAFFCPAESEWLTGLLKEQQRAKAFFRLWTLKEAWAKASGENLLSALRGVCFHQNAQPLLDWQAWSIPLSGDATAALVVRGQGPTNLYGWEWRDDSFRQKPLAAELAVPCR